MNNFPLLGAEQYQQLPAPLNEFVAPFNAFQRDVVLLSSIGCISSILPNYQALYDGGVIYPNLFFMIIAPPASGKGKMKLALNLVAPIHNKIYEDSVAKIEEIRNNQDSEVEVLPPIELKIIPGNASSASLYKQLGANKEALLMFETEADTLTSSLSKEWGGFSDVLRKVWEHEPVSYIRQTGGFSYVEVPKLSVLLSCTPDQIKPLVNNVQNGLFSRFGYYYSEERGEFRRVFDEQGDNSIPFKNSGNEFFFPNYYNLLERESPLTFKLSSSQQERFYVIFTEFLTKIRAELPDDLEPTLMRVGVICMRIAMILTYLRSKDNLTTETAEIICEEVDFGLAITMTKSLLNNAHTVINLIQHPNSLSASQKQWFSNLPDSFSTAKAIEVGASVNVKRRTINDWLKEFKNIGLLKKVRHGEYQKNQ